MIKKRTRVPKKKTEKNKQKVKYFRKIEKNSISKEQSVLYRPKTNRPPKY